ncbi:Fe2+ transport system protein FeoA [Candidatus Thermokryptus mobilis]|uniref:Fe2+ transport system protein FeoA n=2 Tax=Candidatus Thermokryptus mobilis TaxID=1643428 RepID=A0A0S4MUU3_9BACT|nr:Fe2+ transport system protein FeoA [Candidatus Thermokryptus mobilis]
MLRKGKDELMRLTDAKPGYELEIVELPQGNIKTQFVRLGITEGTRIKCAHKLPGGTVVISKRTLEIAIGSDIAKKIFVKKI